jgi:Ser/Thr protein kinase RdoA (MazF antagonist)
LPSERDQNCLLERTDDEKFILKISNPNNDLFLPEMQNLSIELVKSEMKVIQTLDGDRLATLSMGIFKMLR